MPQQTTVLYLLPLCAIILFLSLILVMLMLIMKRLVSLRYDQNKLSESLKRLGIGLHDDTQTYGIVNSQIEDLSRIVINNQEKINELTSSLHNRLDEVRIQLSELSKNPVCNSRTGANVLTDYKDVLAQYLLRNYPHKHTDIMRSITLLPGSTYDPAMLKNHVIETVMSTEFNNMSEAKKADFCQHVNDCLASDSISIFTPQLGQEFDDQSMSLKKQLSASQKVSRVLYFGIRHNDVVILKADVHVG